MSNTAALVALLVARAQAGDRAAFEELIASHQPRLRAYLSKMLPPHVHADDVAQDVWLDVLRDLPRLASAGSFVPWLYRVARNRVYRTMRGRTPAPGPLLDHDPHAPEADDEAFTAEDAAAVHAALDRLEPEHREVLLLRFIESMSYEDIATATGVPLGTVRSRLHNAKRVLRGILAPQFDPT